MFSTHLVSRNSENRVNILFPDKYSYISEGRIETNIYEMQEIDATFSISYTVFYQKNYYARIWNLTFSPSDKKYFTEYDIIKMATFFGSTQERSDTFENTYFLYNGVKSKASELISNNPSFIKWKEIHSMEYNNEHSPSFNLLRNGLIEIDSNYLTSSENNERIALDVFYRSISESVKDIHSLSQFLENNSHLYDFLKTLCGILLGIFDFTRMGPEEIEDTLKPVHSTNKYLTLINRGNLVCIAHDEEILESVSKTIGINPYLLIPSAILAYYQKLFKIIIDKLNDKLCISNLRKYKLKELTKIKFEIENILNNTNLSSIFNYASEKTLVEMANVHRQLESRIFEIRLKLKELTNLIDFKIKQKDGNLKSFISGLLGFISCLQLFQIQWFSATTARTHISLAIFVLISITIIIIINRQNKIYSSKLNLKK